MLSIEKPSQYIAPKVAMSEIGTASVGMMVAEIRRRNRKMTSATRPMVMARVSCTSLIAATIEAERSLSTLSVAVGPRSVVNFGSIAFTESTTLTVLASGWRKTASTSAGLPSYWLAVCVLATESMTRATSPRRTGLPFGVAMMTCRNSSAEVMVVLVWMGSELALPTALVTWSMPMPSAFSAAGSTSARTANFLAPKTCTSPTPSSVERAGEMTCSA